MVTTHPPRFHGEETTFLPGDILIMDRGSGYISFVRNGENLTLNGYPLDPDRPRDALEVGSRLTVGQASNIAKLIGIASGLKVRCTDEDGSRSCFLLFDASTRTFADANA